MARVLQLTENLEALINEIVASVRAGKLRLACSSKTDLAGMQREQMRFQENGGRVLNVMECATFKLSLALSPEEQTIALHGAEWGDEGANPSEEARFFRARLASRLMDVLP